MDSNEHFNIIKNSQLLQKKLIDSVFADYEELIANSTPEEAEDIHSIIIINNQITYFNQNHIFLDK